jgi:hypothetical protein
MWVGSVVVEDSPLRQVWPMIVEAGQEPNFVYELPDHPEQEGKWFVVPSALQMGWTNSPAYFFSTMSSTKQVSWPTTQWLTEIPRRRVSSQVGPRQHGTRVGRDQSPFEVENGIVPQKKPGLPYWKKLCSRKSPSHNSFLKRTRKQTSLRNTWFVPWYQWEEYVATSK